MNTKRVKFASLGEAMVELSHQDDRTLNMNFAGDTLNVAIYLARQQVQFPLEVNYLTALGDDPYSSMMLTSMQQEGVCTDLIPRLSAELPGLYLIRTDAKGERHFFYYRAQSAARKMLQSTQGEKICQALSTFDEIYFSGISLAILDPQSQTVLFETLAKAQQKGARISFDSNYRPKLWSDKIKAQAIVNKAYQLADIILSTYDDEQLLFDDQSLENCLKRLQKFNAQEIVLKRGARGCLLKTGEDVKEIPAQQVKEVIDTTAAGDAFNAAYLGARIQDLSPQQAAKLGRKLAARVIQHRGAIIQRST